MTLCQTHRGLLRDPAWLWYGTLGALPGPGTPGHGSANTGTSSSAHRQVAQAYMDAVSVLK